MLNRLTKCRVASLCFAANAHNLLSSPFAAYFSTTSDLHATIKGHRVITEEVLLSQILFHLGDSELWSCLLDFDLELC